MTSVLALLKTFTYSRRSKRTEGRLTCDGLSHKDGGGTPFSVVHFFAEHLDEREADVIVAMVRSIRVATPHLD
jgi:hypothetical protein